MAAGRATDGQTNLMEILERRQSGISLAGILFAFILVLIDPFARQSWRVSILFWGTIIL